jgi:transposase
MNFGRELVKKHFSEGKKPVEIFKLVKLHGIKRDFVYRTIRRLRETGTINDRPRSGRPRSVRTKERIKRIREKIRRNPARSSRKMAKEENVSRFAMDSILRDDLGLRPYRKRKVHGLTQKQKDKRLERCAKLAKRHAGRKVEKIVFSDEKFFVLQQCHNAKNNVVYAKGFEEIPEHLRSVQRFQNTSGIMIWGAVSQRGKLPLIFIDRGIKINSKYYQREVLQSTLLPEANRLYPDGKWTFQQDSAPAHSSNATQAWCRANLPNFITKDEWPPSSPDLNPLDFSVWGMLEPMVSERQHTSIDAFKRALIREWKKLPMSMVRAAIGSWHKRLEAVVTRDGGRFE